jgi:hypothetical protein
MDQPEAPKEYFMLNGLENNECAAFTFRVEVSALSLKMEVDHKQLFCGP